MSLIDSQLVSAAYRGDLKDLKRLMRRGANLEAKVNMKIDGFTCYDNLTPLTAAALTGQFACIQALINKGAVINALNGQHQHALSVICEAMTGQDAQAIARYLIEQGVTINHQDSLGRTPLHLAFSNHRINISWVMLLLENGADPTLKNNLGDDIFSFINHPDLLDCIRAFQEKQTLKLTMASQEMARSVATNLTF